MSASNDFPLTPALSLGEREQRIPSLDKPGRSDPSHRLPAILPLPWYVFSVPAALKAWSPGFSRLGIRLEPARHKFGRAAG
jgi:hypothetical protein